MASNSPLTAPFEKTGPRCSYNRDVPLPVVDTNHSEDDRENIFPCEVRSPSSQSGSGLSMAKAFHFTFQECNLLLEPKFCPFLSSPNRAKQQNSKDLRNTISRRGVAQHLLLFTVY